MYDGGNAIILLVPIINSRPALYWSATLSLFTGISLPVHCQKNVFIRLILSIIPNNI